MEHPYMFQYSCNNPTFGYDFQCYARELGANRMYDHTQRGGGMHFYTVPSEDVYNKLKEVAKQKFTVDMYPLRPFDKERYANAKIQEAMMYYPSDDYDRDNSDYHKMMAQEEASHPYVGRKVRWKEGRRILTVTGAYDWRNGDTLVRCGNISLKPDEYELIKEDMTIAYSKETIDNQIKVIEQNIEDYKQLIIEYPDDKENWEEEIKKCQDMIDDLKSYKPLEEADNQEILYVIKDSHGNQLSAPNPDDGELWDRVSSMEARGRRGLCVVVYTGKKMNEAWDDTETIHAAYDAYVEDCAWKQVDPISFEKFRNNYLGDKEESEEEFNSRIKYWAVLATDKDTGKEYYAGVYESERWAYYWAGMDRSADAEYGYGNFDYRVEQVSEYNEEMDKSKSELNNLKLSNYDNRKYESIKRLGAGGRKLIEAKKGFLCKYKGCSIHDMGDMFVATNSTGLNIGQSKTRAGLEGIIDDYVANKSDVKSIEEATGNRGFYVTTYWPDERWSPEEGGSMSYGWDANRSKFFRTEQEAQEYVDYILDGCEIISNYEGEYEYRDEDGDLMKIAIEPFHKRGKGHSPARSWAEAEFDMPAERPYFDRKGNRVARNPRLVAKEKKDAIELEKEFLSGIDSATTRKELIDFISDIKYSKLFQDNSKLIGDKWKSLKEAVPLGGLSKDAPYDVKSMDLERVPSILNWDVADQLQDCFRDNKLWVDELHYNQVRDRIEFDINWGDWKHEHLRARWLLQELFEKLGIEAEIDSYTTEEDGSDTYSAHYNVYATGKR